MSLQEIITKDEQDRIVRSSFYLNNRPSDVSHTVSYKFARDSLIESGLFMELDDDYTWNQYQRRHNSYTLK